MNYAIIVMMLAPTVLGYYVGDKLPGWRRNLKLRGKREVWEWDADTGEIVPRYMRRVAGSNDVTQPEVGAAPARRLILQSEARAQFNGRSIHVVQAGTGWGLRPPTTTEVDGDEHLRVLRVVSPEVYASHVSANRYAQATNANDDKDPLSWVRTAIVVGAVVAVIVVGLLVYLVTHAAGK